MSHYQSLSLDASSQSLCSLSCLPSDLVPARILGLISLFLAALPAASQALCSLFLFLCPQASTDGCTHRGAVAPAVAYLWPGGPQPSMSHSVTLSEGPEDPCLPGAHMEARRRCLIPLKMEFWIVLSYPVGAGN